MATVTELVTKFSYQGSSEPLTGYNETLGKSISLLGSMAKVTGAATVAALAMVTATNADTAAMANLAESVGLSVQEMQAYGSVAKSMGLDQDIVVDLVEEMNNKLGESFSLMAKGEKPLSAVSDALGMVGMEAKELEGLSPDEQFRKIAKALNEMPNQQQAASAADILFGGEANKFFSAMDKQGKSLDSLIGQYSKINFLTKEGTEGAKKYSASVRSFSTLFTSVGREVSGIIGGELTPDITDLTKSISEVFKENRGWIVDGLKKTVDIASSVGGALQRLAPLITAVGLAFLAAKVYAVGFAGIMGVISSPVVIVAAAIASAVLVIDDLIVAFQGGNSVIANFMQEWLGIDIQPILQSIVDGVTWMVGQIKDIGSAIIDAIVAPFKWAVGAAIKDFERIKSAVSWAMEAGEAVAGFFGGNDNQAERFTGRTGGGMDFTQPSSPAIASAGATTNNSSSNSSVQQTNSITINATSPQDAMEIGDNLQTQLADAERLAQRGGR